MAREKHIYTKSEIQVALEAYALHGTYKAAGEALSQLLDTKVNKTEMAKNIIDTYRYDPAYAEIFTEKQLDVSHLALTLAERSFRLADRRLEFAYLNEEKIQKLINSISADSEMGLSKEDKKKIIDTLKIVKIDKLSEIATTGAIGYDKHRLANGDSTDNSEIRVKYEGNDLDEFGN